MVTIAEVWLSQILTPTDYLMPLQAVGIVLERSFREIQNDCSGPQSSIFENSISTIRNARDEEWRTEKGLNPCLYMHICSFCGGGLGRNVCSFCGKKFRDDGVRNGDNIPTPKKIEDFLKEIFGHVFEKNPQLARDREAIRWRKRTERYPSLLTLD